MITLGKLDIISKHIKDYKEVVSLIIQVSNAINDNSGLQSTLDFTVDKFTETGATEKAVDIHMKPDNAMTSRLLVVIFDQLQKERE